MKRMVWIEVETINPSRVLLKLFKQNINIIESQYTSLGLRFKIDASEVKKLKKIVGYRFQKYRKVVFMH